MQSPMNSDDEFEIEPVASIYVDEEYPPENTINDLVESNIKGSSDHHSQTSNSKRRNSNSSIDTKHSHSSIDPAYSQSSNDSRRHPNIETVLQKMGNIINELNSVVSKHIKVKSLHLVWVMRDIYCLLQVFKYRTIFAYFI